jgi:hypothetical protein
MARNRKKTPDVDDWLRELDQYEAELAPLMEKERVERDAREGAAAAAKIAETTKSVQDREYFSLGEIADALARPAGLAKPDADEREYICRQLIDTAQRGEFFGRSRAAWRLYSPWGCPFLQTASGDGGICRRSDGNIYAGPGQDILVTICSSSVFA